MKFAAHKWLKISSFLALGLVVAIVVFFRFGTPAWRWYYLWRCDGNIAAAGKRIDAATDDTARAKAYDDRARAYREKARFSGTFKLVEPAEYEKQFVMALLDHIRAIMLTPKDTRLHFSRGRTYYDRATVNLTDGKNRAIYNLAEGDFTRALEGDPAQSEYWEFRGLVRLANNELDGAIGDFERMATLDPKRGGARLADALCARGSGHQAAKRDDDAIRDFERSLSVSSDCDGCRCDPHAPLAWLYLDSKQDYAKSWDTVRRARAAGKPLDSAMVEKLKAAAGRSE